MSDPFVSVESLRDMNLWTRLQKKRVPVSFDIEITARCNNDCRHCYINLPAGDRRAKAQELTLAEIDRIAGEAASMGAVWCLLTGGEPLLREDFADIYMACKRHGLLVSVFTNGCLINKDHIELFKKYPPRDVEVTVYGVTEETYERVSRKHGTFAAFMRGLDLLFEANMPVRLKAVAIQSNVDEMPAIAEFCRKYTKDFFRFDPIMHLRYDGSPVRNAEIRSERLSPERIVEIEQADQAHYDALLKKCGADAQNLQEHAGCDCSFHCGAGLSSFSVNYLGMFRMCSTLHHPDTMFDLRKMSVAEAWAHVPAVRSMHAKNPQFLEKCRTCTITSLCANCSANAYLETGAMDDWVEYFCDVAHARAAALRESQQIHFLTPIST